MAVVAKLSAVKKAVKVYAVRRLASRRANCEVKDSYRMQNLFVYLLT